MDSLILIAVAGLILIGLIGIVVPVLPGVGLIYAGILLYAFSFGTETIGGATLIVLGMAALLSVALDYLASAYGAKRFGATRSGSLGAILGGFFGFIILNVPGLLLGIFAGAVLGELVVAKRDMEGSLRAGLGAMLGFLGGTVLKFILGIVMIGVFLWKVLT